MTAQTNDACADHLATAAGAKIPADEKAHQTELAAAQTAFAASPETKDAPEYERLGGALAVRGIAGIARGIGLTLSRASKAEHDKEIWEPLVDLQAQCRKAFRAAFALKDVTTSREKFMKHGDRYEAKAREHDELYCSLVRDNKLRPSQYMNPT